VILASGVPTRGTPLNASLARWLPGIVPRGTEPDLAGPDIADTAATQRIAGAERETACLAEV
jgi:hypothetical protein